MRTLNSAVVTGLQGVTSQIAALQVSQQREFATKTEITDAQRRADDAHQHLEFNQGSLFSRSEETHKRLDARIDRNEDRLTNLEGKAWMLILAICGAGLSFVIGIIDMLARSAFHMP